MILKRNPRTVFYVLVVLPWIGCLGKAPIRKPIPPPPEQAQPTKAQEMAAQLEGVWESPGKNGQVKKMVFAADRRLTFEGGLESYNPARWDLNPGRSELTITMPGIDVDKMQIFQLYVGKGVKAFNPSQRQVTYSFDSQTWTLNFAGWEYSKVDKAGTEKPEAEPVLK